MDSGLYVFNKTKEETKKDFAVFQSILAEKKAKINNR